MTDSNSHRTFASLPYAAAKVLSASVPLSTLPWLGAGGASIVSHDFHLCGGVASIVYTARDHHDRSVCRGTLVARFDPSTPASCCWKINVPPFFLDQGKALSLPTRERKIYVEVPHPYKAGFVHRATFTKWDAINHFYLDGSTKFGPFRSC